jgi:tripartite-type tricarboxylate transporter receptor subunit TctC
MGRLWAIKGHLAPSDAREIRVSCRPVEPKAGCGESTMKLLRRQFLRRATGAAALPAAALTALGQSYPARPVKIIVAAGGGAVIIARLIGQWLSERLGQFFLVENRPGGNNNIGTEAAVRAPADGYTLLLATSANAINASLDGRLSFDFIRDTVPVAHIADMPFVMVVKPQFPARTVPEFIAYAKANPGKLNFGSGGELFGILGPC